MKPGKVMVAECSCRFLVVDVGQVKNDGPEMRLLVARCREYHDACALAYAVSEQENTARGEVWFLHGNGKERSLELVRAVGRAVDWSNPGFTAPALSVRPLVLPTKGPIPA